MKLKIFGIELETQKNFLPMFLAVVGVIGGCAVYFDHLVIDEITVGLALFAGLVLSMYIKGTMTKDFNL